MSGIKVMKDGNNDFTECIKIINEKFILIQKIKRDIDSVLSSRKWTGYAKEQCEDMHLLTEIYRYKLYTHFYELERINSELKRNVNSFVTAAVVKNL